MGKEGEMNKRELLKAEKEIHEIGRPYAFIAASPSAYKWLKAHYGLSFAGVPIKRDTVLRDGVVHVCDNRWDIWPPGDLRK